MAEAPKTPAPDSRLSREMDPSSGTRDPRENGTREATQRRKSWQPPTTLPSPAPQEGWVFRWIRTGLMGSIDPTNASAKFREGWEPVKAADHPELKLFASTKSPYPDGIEVGGLLLCKAPREMVEQRAAYYANHAKTQMDAVNSNYMQVQADERMPVLNESRRTKVTFGRGD